MKSAWTQWAWRQLGWPGILGFVLIVAGVLTELAVRQPMAARVQELEQRAGLAERAAGRPAATLGAELERFYGHFKREEDVNDWLAVLNHIAEESGVELGVAEYRKTPDPVLALAAYEISVPLSGSYGKIRAFAESALESIPVASLDALRFTRKRVNSGQVEAEMRLTFYIPAR